MPQNPQFTPDSRFTPDDRFTPDETPHEEPSMLSRGWHILSDPLSDLPSRFTKSISDWMGDAPIEQETGQGGMHDYFANTNAKARGFFQGATEGLGHIGDALTSPLSLATMGLGGVEYGADKAGLDSIASLARMGNKATGVPLMLHGGAEVINPDSTLSERAAGLGELAGGSLAAFHAPSAKIDTPSPTPPKLSEIGGSVVKGKTDIAPIEGSFFDRMPKQDPNLNQGVGDAELAGSTPYTAPPEVTPPKPTMQTAPLGQTIIIRKEGATPAIIKQAKEAGFDFQGLNDQGHFRFKKIVEPTAQPILESEVAENRPTQGNVDRLGPLTDAKKSSPLVEAFNLPRGIMAAGDLSAPLRQGIGLIHKKQFWTALKPMFQSLASEDAFRASQEAIMERPLFKERAGPNGTVLPSFAEDSGLKLTDLTNLSKREEAIMSNWAEKVPGVRPSNRAYTAFLNNLRADTFESLLKDGKVFGADAKVNLPLARELANFVNIASGRGSLGKLEPSAVALNSMFFSPRLIAARVQMLNPAYYIMASPQVRQEALKSLFAIAAAGNTVTQLGRIAGGTVSDDPTSSDFGKLKIGDTRLDPFGGFQQYIVAASRLLSGKVTSSSSGNEYDLKNPEGPYDPTYGDVLERFGRGKLHPVVGFAYSLLKGQKEMSGKPMDFTTLNPMENAVSQRFIPILLQDLYSISNDETIPPSTKALIATAASFGMGTQTYGPQ